MENWQALALKKQKVLSSFLIKAKSKDSESEDAAE